MWYFPLTAGKWFKYPYLKALNNYTLFVLNYLNWKCPRTVVQQLVYLNRTILLSYLNRNVAIAAYCSALNHDEFQAVDF